MSLMVYLLKVIVVSAIFYGYYRLFLRNKRFHHYNRFFLLSALLLSIVLPFIRIPILYQPENPVHEAMYRTVSVYNADYDETLATGEIAPVNESVFTLMNSIYLLYAIGVLFLLTLVIKSLLYIRGLRKRYPAEKITSLRFYNTHEPGTPFSFFKSIFWNEQLPFNSYEGQQIFRHELFHVQHKHSADRMLTEVLTAIFWFNPFFHLIKKELKAIHEFLADQFAISDNDRYAYATLLVQQALESGRHTITNHFFQDHIKRRIAMITQFQQSNYGYWSRVMILPVSILLFCFITLYAVKPAMGAETKKPLDAELATISDEGNNNKTGLAYTDTVPAKEIELRKLREQKMLELRKKIEEHEAIVRKAQTEELEQLKKQMQEHELLAREQEEIRKKQVEELTRIRREMKERQQSLVRERNAELKELEKAIKDKDREKGFDNGSDIRLEESKKRLKDLQEQIDNKIETENKIIEARIREIEQKAEHQQEKQNSQHEQMIQLRKKIIERQKELDKERQEAIDHYKDELKKEFSEEKAREQERKQREQERKALEQKMTASEQERKRREQERKNREKEEKRREKERKEENDRNDQQSQRFSPRQLGNGDSLLTNVIRHYLRNLRYPGKAVEKGVEANIYFSIVVDKNGVCKDLIIYTQPPAQPVKELVIVTNTQPVSVSDQGLTTAQQEAMFKGEVERVTARSETKPIAHAEERKYYFKAVWRVERNINNANTFQLQQKEDWNLNKQVAFSWAMPFEIYQDTVPRIKKEKRISVNEGKEVKVFEMDARKPRPVRVEDGRIQKPKQPSEPRKPVEISKTERTAKVNVFERKRVEFNRDGKRVHKERVEKKPLFKSEKKLNLQEGKKPSPLKSEKKIELNRKNKVETKNGAGSATGEQESEENYSVSVSATSE